VDETHHHDLGRSISAANLVVPDNVLPARFQAARRSRFALAMRLNTVPEGIPRLRAMSLMESSRRK
jgi:hypothetical protein